MSNEHGYWTLSIQKNRDTGNRIYKSLRIYPPTNRDTEPLREKLEAQDGEHTKVHYKAKIQNHGSRIILEEVQLVAKRSTPELNLVNRADEIITIIAQLGGTVTWPMVREKLGRPVESMPGPHLLQALRERGLHTFKNPKTSTMIWKLIDREKLNGWTQH
jgi:hypothetical protein